VIGWFWRAVESFSAEEKSALLGFWTGASALGPTGRGLHSFTLELNLSNSRTHA